MINPQLETEIAIMSLTRLLSHMKQTNDAWGMEDCADMINQLRNMREEFGYTNGDVHTDNL